MHLLIADGIKINMEKIINKHKHSKNKVTSETFSVSSNVGYCQCEIPLET